MIEDKLKEKKKYDIESGREAMIAAMETKQVLEVDDTQDKFVNDPNAIVNQNATLISITVGKKPSEAQFYVNNTKEVKDLITKFTFKLAKSKSSFDINMAAKVAQFQNEQEKEE